MILKIVRRNRGTKSDFFFNQNCLKMIVQPLFRIPFDTNEQLKLITIHVSCHAVFQPVSDPGCDLG